MKSKSLQISIYSLCQRLVTEILHGIRMSPSVLFIVISLQLIVDSGTEFRPSPQDFQPSPHNSPVFCLLTNSSQHNEGGNNYHESALKPSYDPYDDDLSAEQYDAGRLNYKCEESEETIFITKTEVITEKRCFTQYRVECSEVYIGGKVRWKKEKP